MTRTVRLTMFFLSTGMIIESASSATVPAGTILLVQTNQAISSRDPAGRRFEARLARNVEVDGKIVVPAGTAVAGVIKSPAFTVASTSRPLTLRLTEVVIRGHGVLIKTNDLEVENNSPWTAGRRRIQVSGSSFLLPQGTALQFRLIQPVGM